MKEEVGLKSLKKFKSFNQIRKQVKPAIIRAAVPALKPPIIILPKAITSIEEARSRKFQSALLMTKNYFL